MHYLRNYVSGHFQYKSWIPIIIYLLEALPLSNSSLIFVLVYSPFYNDIKLVPENKP
jgi:hypothetical protein